MKDAVKTEWQVRPLGEVVTLNYGKALARSERDPNGSVPVYGANGVMDWSEHTLAEGPSLVVGRKGSAGEVTRVDGPFWPSDVTYYTTHDHDALDFDFLHYTLKTLNLPSMARGVKPGINRNDVYALPIPLPPLEEQQRIVAVLDEAFEGLARARAHGEANLQNARELFENFLGAIFSRNASDWTSAPLQQVVESDCSLSYGIVQPGDEVSGGLPIVRPTDLGQRIITLDGLKRIDSAKADGYARTKLMGTEILLCVRGSTGVVSMASEELYGANVTRGIVPVRFDSGIIDQRLGYYQFLSGLVQDQIRAKTYGAALMQINICDVRKLTFYIPPLSQQESLLERLESVANDFDALIEDYSRKVSDLDDLRQALLQKAFVGELT